MIESENIRKMLNETFERSFIAEISKRADDDDGDVFEIAFSSETVVSRYFGDEVLVHDPQGVNLDRMNTGGAVLVNHDTDDQVGVVVDGSARIDSDKKGRCSVRFSRSVRGQEIKMDVEDGVRRNVSCRYRIIKYEVEERGGKADMYRILEWEVLEISFTPIPADPDVGVNRSLELETAQADENTSKSESPGTGSDPQPDPKRHNEEITMIEEERKAQEEEQRKEREKERNRVRTEEKSRMDAIRSIGDEHDCAEMAREAIDNDTTVDDFRQEVLKKIGERNAAAKADSGHDGEVDLNESERQQFSITKLMDALADPKDRAAQERAAFEFEVSAAAVREFGSDFNVRGAFVPTSLLHGRRSAPVSINSLDDLARALSAGTATDGAELVATNLLAGSFIDVLRNASALIGSGAVYLPGLVGNVDIPRQTSGAVASWISAEDGDASESEAQFDQVSMTPKDLACYTEATRRLMQQGTPGVEGIMRNDLATAQALGTDLGGLYGSGASGQPRGVVNQTGINKVVFSAADPDYDELVAMVKAVKEDNALTGRPRWLIESNGWEALMTTLKSSGDTSSNFILNPDTNRILGYEYGESEQLTAEDYLFGDWSQVIIGEWGGVEINVDPYTHSLKGRIRYVMFRTSDVMVRRATHFCLGNNTP